MENEKEINSTFWDTRIFIKFHKFLRPDLQCPLVCFTQESVSFHVTYREEIGKDEASGGTSKPQNRLKCSERRLRNKLDDLAQYFMHYMYSNHRKLGCLFFYFIIVLAVQMHLKTHGPLCSPTHTVCTGRKIMSKLKKILWDTLVPEKCSSKKVSLEPEIIFFSVQVKLGRNFAIDLKEDRISPYVQGWGTLSL